MPGWADTQLMLLYQKTEPIVAHSGNFWPNGGPSILVREMAQSYL